MGALWRRWTEPVHAGHHKHAIDAAGAGRSGRVLAKASAARRFRDNATATRRRRLALHPPSGKIALDRGGSLEGRADRSAGRQPRAAMYLSNESIIAILIVGLIAGWLAGKIVRGAGFGLIGDVAIGIIGAFIGDWLLPRLGIHLGTGIVSAVVNATIGAVLLLLIISLVRGRSGARWGRRW
jgi:uncharacterized membrane protein YeaQ/YmgE (transglycosylase-associated protein family)